MPHRYSSAFSHLVLAGTGFYCLGAYHGGQFRLPCLSYSVIIANSLLGVWRWGNPEHGHKIDGIYQFTGFLQRILVFPLIVTEVWLGYGYQPEIAYLHVVATVLPFTLYLADKSTDYSVDTMIAVDIVSLDIVATWHENYYGFAASISYLLNHFFLREGKIDIENVPVLDLYNYGLCFFCYFALRTLLAGKA